MKRRHVAVLDFGSSKLSAIVGERGVNGTFVMKGVQEIEYEGFFEGEFLDPAELEEAIEKILTDLSSDCESPITKLYVGVPGEFVSVILREKTLSYDKKRKITQREVDELFDAGLRSNFNRYRLIDRSAVYFILDDKRRIVDPVGLVSDKLGGYLSYSLADVSFENLIRPMIGKCGIDDIVFVSSMLAESMFLFDPDKRDRFAMLLDVGHLTSSLVIVRGDGILYQKSMPLGGGHISADLAYYLDTDYRVAEQLKRKINISQRASLSTYDVQMGEELFSFSAEKCHDIIKNNLDHLCEQIEECLRKCEIAYPEYLPLHITGGGVLPMRGCKEYISNRIDRVVEAIVPNLPMENKPTDSSKYGLLDYALMKEESEKIGFFQKLFGRR